MANGSGSRDVSATMDKLSLNGNGDTSKYPHRKHGLPFRQSAPTAISGMNDSDQYTTTAAPTSESQKEGVPAPEESPQTMKTAITPAVDGPGPHQQPRKLGPHHKLASPSATTPTASDTANTTSPATKSSAVADSWEDDAASDAEAATASNISVETEREALPPSVEPEQRQSEPEQKPARAVYRAPHHRLASTPAPPPPTPASPGARSAREDYTSTPSNSTSRSSTPSDRRPEKTTAVASRLIAGALGVRAPRRTPEQREYDKAVREQEKKRRDAEREAKKKAEEDAARAKAAVWDD